jgi:hypothetical protein
MALTQIITKKRVYVNEINAFSPAKEFEEISTKSIKAMKEIHDRMKCLANELSL